MQAERCLGMRSAVGARWCGKFLLPCSRPCVIRHVRGPIAGHVLTRALHAHAGIAVVHRERDSAYGLTLVWALVAVYGHQTHSALVRTPRRSGYRFGRALADPGSAGKGLAYVGRSTTAAWK